MQDHVITACGDKIGGRVPHRADVRRRMGLTGLEAKKSIRFDLDDVQTRVAGKYRTALAIPRRSDWAPIRLGRGLLCRMTCILYRANLKGK